MKYDPVTHTYDRSVRFTRGYKGGRKSSDANSRPSTEAFRHGCDLMGWDKLSQFCTGCGRLPAWCECTQAEQRRITNG